MKKLAMISLIATSILFTGCGSDGGGDGESYFDRFGKIGSDSDSAKDGRGNASNDKNTNKGNSSNQSNTNNGSSSKSSHTGTVGRLNSDLTMEQYSEVLVASNWCGQIGATSIGVIFYSDGTGEIFDVNNASNPDNQSFVWKVQDSPMNAKAAYSVNFKYDDGHVETAPLAAMNGYLIMFLGSRQMVYSKCSL